MTIYKGKNVDEAIEKGLTTLNLKKHEVRINIIEKGQAGVFGFFEKEAEVDITPLTEKELKFKKMTPYLVEAAFLFSFCVMLLLAIFQDNKPTTASSSATSTTIVEKTSEQTGEPSTKETSSTSSVITSITTSSPSTTETPSTTSSPSTNIITVENNEEFKTLLQTDDQNTIKDFIKKYKGQTIEFDGHIVNLLKIKSKYDILIYAGNYHPDEATGPNFKFVEISLISNPVFNSFNGENIKVGQDVRIKAKVEGYNEKQELVFLSPIEVSPR